MGAAHRYEIWRDSKTGRYCVTAVVSPMFDAEEHAKEHRRALIDAEKADVRSTAYLLKQASEAVESPIVRLSLELSRLPRCCE